jgi:hypothetical protein
MKVTRLLIFIVFSLLLVSCGKSNDGDWFIDYKKTFGTTAEEIKKNTGEDFGLLGIAIVSHYMDVVTIKGNTLEIIDSEKKIGTKCIINKFNEKNGIECIRKKYENDKETGEEKVLYSLLQVKESLRLDFDSNETKGFNGFYLTKIKQDPKQIYKDSMNLNSTPESNNKIETPEQCYERRYKEISAASEKELIADGQKGPYGEAELVPQGVRMGIEEDCASKK